MSFSTPLRSAFLLPRVFKTFRLPSPGNFGRSAFESSFDLEVKTEGNFRVSRTSVEIKTVDIFRKIHLFLLGKIESLLSLSHAIPLPHTDPLMAFTWPQYNERIWGKSHQNIPIVAPLRIAWTTPSISTLNSGWALRGISITFERTIFAKNLKNCGDKIDHIIEWWRSSGSEWTKILENDCFFWPHGVERRGKKGNVSRSHKNCRYLALFGPTTENRLKSS